MPFVSPPNWVATGTSVGAWDICPHVSTTTDDGNLQGYTEYHGGPGRSSYLTFSQTLSYDNLNRLTSATNNGGWSRNFSYDQYSNMTPSVGSGTNYIALAGNSPTAFNAANNQISGPTGTTYDAAGNQTLVNGNAVAYDAENRTKSLASGAWTYSFDGLGQRVKKAPFSGSSTAYVYDAFGQLAAEYTSGTTWARDYIRWGSSGALIATENASGPCTTCYFGYDHLGSIKVVMDQSANVIGRHDFLPYGEEVPASTAGRDSTFGPAVDTVTTKFTSQLRDSESGMDYFNARNFTAPLGRFMSPDPENAGADLTDPQTWNGYAYVRNSPLHMVDPSGMDGFSPGGGDPDPDPCIFDCDPFPPYEGGGWGGGSPVSTPPSPPRETSSSGGNPLPPGSFPGGETLGLPPGIGVPSVLQLLLGGGGCDFGPCGPNLGPSGFVDPRAPIDPDSIEEHHIFIQSWRNWFRAQDIDVDDYLIKLSAGFHRFKAYNGIHTNDGGNWNRVWAAFRERFPQATREEMFDQARKMIKDFNLGKFPGATLDAPVFIMIDPCLYNVRMRLMGACDRPIDHI